ncbi:MAG: gliding motility-associated C-terminal domain-containing protein [Chitinophagaceae bacterium]|nr:gliding motility-associated C-terminal domain-containing protein [Chitinophagaceae bacterium]
MPTLIQGHEYLLLVSHFTDGQSGYDLSFGGGTAVITDPLEPHLKSVKPDCDGKTLTLKLNKKIRCNSLTAPGTEFSLVPNVASVVSATTTSCSSGFDFDELTITLSAAIPNGNYDLVIRNGSDNNTLLDVCNRSIPEGEIASFYYAIPQPIFADSIEKPKCTPDSVRVFFPKKIACNTVASNGSDFSVAGPTPVTVISATGTCINNKTDVITVKFASPIYIKGNYLLTLRAGDDGTVIIDECGQEMPLQTLPFSTVDTVNADFFTLNNMACRIDTLTFTHNGAHDVTMWNWTFDGVPVNTQSHTVTWPAISNHTVTLNVSNGVCGDTSSQDIKLDHEVKADFTMPSLICPEDKLEIINTSTGLIDNWKWNFDVLSSSTLKDPPPFQFPMLNREAYYTVKLTVSNNAIKCADSARKTVTVLDFCLIEVPSAFTPNNDGLNDYFQPHNAIKADNYEFKVYNRWGQLVFQSNNWRDKWDGRYKGQLQGTGVFVWMLNYIHRETQQPVFRKGTVTLIR